MFARASLSSEALASCLRSSRKVLPRTKHSSLFCQSISGREKSCRKLTPPINVDEREKFYNIQRQSQFSTIFFSLTKTPPLRRVFVLCKPFMLDLRYEGKGLMEMLTRANTLAYFSRPSLTNEKVS